jgi:hypothetical protein
MKNPYIATFFVILLTLSVSAQTVIDDLSFSSVDSTQKVGVSLNLDGALTEEDAENLNIHLSQCMNKNIHPLEWSKGVHQDVNLFFKISGDIDDVFDAVGKHLSLDNKAVSWIWAGAKNPTIKIYLGQSGVGSIKLEQDGAIVGSATCRSAEDGDRPTEEHCKVVKVWSNPAPEEYSQNDQKPTFGRRSIAYNSWMPWALETNNSSEGIFIHGGSQASSSKGCIRVPKKFAEMLHSITKAGSQVSITYVR